MKTAQRFTQSLFMALLAAASAPALAGVYAEQYCKLQDHADGSGKTFNIGALSPESICAGVTLLGVTGTADCISSPVAGLAPENICAGVTILGITGVANCASDHPDFTDHMVSTAYRDFGSAQMSLKQESTAGLAPNYRKIPDLRKDTTLAYYSNSSNFVNHALITQDCGYSQSSVAERIADCAARNGAVATFDGAARGISAEGVWKLVTRINGKETWRDERTKLLWSDSFGQTTSWCRAAGSRDPMDTYLYGCSNFGYKRGPGTTLVAQLPPPALPESWCAEGANVQTPDVTAFNDAKGRMRLSGTATRVSWRLPTQNDYMMAMLNGLRSVLPNLKNAKNQPYYYHTATADGLAWNDSLTFRGTDGAISYFPYYSNRSRTTYTHVRCIGNEVQ